MIRPLMVPIPRTIMTVMTINDHDKTTMMMTTRMTACNVCNHSITHTASLSRMALGKTSRRALQ